MIDKIYEENSKVYKEVRNLIKLKTEGSYWDFKREWHSKNIDLLHDIICMANNLEDRDAYIIIGIDKTGNISGVPEKKRKKQEDLINVLRDKPVFAGGIRPVVYVQTLEMMDEEGDKKEIDVIIIKNTSHTPYYLTEDYEDGRSLYARNIYTRIVDTNTSIKETADPNHVEWLWKKRFGLVGSAESRLKIILQSEGWIREEEPYKDTHNFGYYFFNQYYPEIYIDVDEIKTDSQVRHDDFFYLYANPMFWSGAGNEELSRRRYRIHWYGKKWESFSTVSATRMDFEFVELKIRWLDSGIGIVVPDAESHGAQYAYFVEDSIEYGMLKMMLSLDAEYIKGKYPKLLSDLGMGVIPVFENDREHNDFMKYLLENGDKFKSEYETTELDGHMFSGAKADEDPRIAQSLKVGRLLVKWLKKWRNS
ncbi:MAG: ATP-binding protein [Defluviitaleaceae bacterium]|nr:ATP-binding protein [Defluviitaleaceae bacterium]